jgi:hypothetical protein
LLSELNRRDKFATPFANVDVKLLNTEPTSYFNIDNS